MSPQRPAVTPKDFPKKDANELYLRLIGKSEATTPTGLVIVNDDSSYASGCNNQKNNNRYGHIKVDGTDDFVETENKSFKRVLTSFSDI